MRTFGRFPGFEEVPCVTAIVGTASCGSDVAGSDAEECSLKKAREVARSAARSTFLGSV